VHTNNLVFCLCFTLCDAGNVSMSSNIKPAATDSLQFSREDSGYHWYIVYANIIVADSVK
jgi:hypothetical protein